MADGAMCFSLRFALPLSLSRQEVPLEFFDLTGMTELKANRQSSSLSSSRWADEDLIVAIIIP